LRKERIRAGLYMITGIKQDVNYGHFCLIAKCFCPIVYCKGMRTKASSAYIASLNPMAKTGCFCSGEGSDRQNAGGETQKKL